MARQFVRAGDYGTPINIYVTSADGSAKDLSLATDLTVTFTRPAAAALTGPLSYGSDGTDGWVIYTTADGDFTSAHVGTVTARVRITTPSGSWSTGAGSFDVEAVTP